MALQQIDLDTVQPNNKRGVPGRTAMTIVNQNSAETEQRVAALEAGGPQVDQRIAALDLALEEEQAARAAADSDLALAFNALSGRMMGKNRLINGNFDFWQRGTSFSGPTFAGYTADRFYVEMGSMAGCTCTRQPVTPGNPGFKADPAYAMQFDYTGNTNAAGHYLLLHQRAEDVRVWAGSETMLSFTVFNSGAAGRQIAIEFIQHFGTGGSAPITGLLARKITLSAGFNYVEVPFTLPSVTGKSIGPNSYADAIVWLSGGSSFNARNGSLGAQSGQLIFSALQWEEGSVATGFERRPAGLELVLCQRYFQKSFPAEVAPTLNHPGVHAPAVGFSATAARIYQPFRVEMRATPAITIYRGQETSAGNTGSIQLYYPTAGAWDSTNNAANVSSARPTGFQVDAFPTFPVGGASTYIAAFNWTADGEI